MRLPRSALKSTMQLLALVDGPKDALGQSVKSWQPVGPAHACGHFPAGARVVELAQLAKVAVSREVYAEVQGVDPLKHQVVIDGVRYKVTLVDAWEGFTVLGVVSA